MCAEPYDPQRPVLCFDETSTQMLSDIRSSLPAEAGKSRREDYEYRRQGTRNLFLACETLAGWRHVAVTERRTMRDFAHQMKWLVDEAYPDVSVIRLVLDNLNTHRMASLYETFSLRRPGASLNDWSSITLPYPPAGSIWRRSNPACWPGPACGDATRMRTTWKGRSTPESQNATLPQPPLTGGSPPRTPELNSADSILTLQL